MLQIRDALQRVASNQGQAAPWCQSSSTAAPATCLFQACYSYLTSSQLSSTLLAFQNPDKYQHPSRVPKIIRAGCSPVTCLQLHMSKVAADFSLTDCLNALRASKSYDGVASQAQLSCSGNSMEKAARRRPAPCARIMRQHKPTFRSCMEDAQAGSLLGVHPKMVHVTLAAKQNKS